MTREYNDGAPYDSNAPSRRRFLVREMMGRQRQVTLEHAGQDYLLRITRKGKLILTK